MKEDIDYWILAQEYLRKSMEDEPDRAFARAAGFGKEAQKLALGIHIENGGTFKSKFDFPFAITAYEYQLENGGHPNESLEAAMVVHGRSPEWVAEAKDGKFGLAKEVVDSFRNHPEQNNLVKKGAYSVRDARKDRRLTTLLNRVNASQEFRERVENLEDKTRKLEAKVATLEAQNKGKPYSRADEVRLLIEEHNWSQSQTAKHFGVSERTIRRYLKQSV